MRILLDECVNPRLRLAFPGDEVKTVAEMGWRALTNGALMMEAASRFDVFVTLDQNLQFQNQTGKHRLGIVVLDHSVQPRCRLPATVWGDPRFSQANETRTGQRPSNRVAADVAGCDRPHRTATRGRGAVVAQLSLKASAIRLWASANSQRPRKTESSAPFSRRHVSEVTAMAAFRGSGAS
jgi:hypothetical protein